MILVCMTMNRFAEKKEACFLARPSGFNESLMRGMLGACLGLGFMLHGCLIPWLRAQVISEIMVSEAEHPYLDEDQDATDWIEIYNPLDKPISLEGWSLSDEVERPAKWVFPAVSLQSHGFLLVHASGKNYTDAAWPLHTNFKLRLEGEFLGLFDPQGNQVSGFDPSFPPQHEGISYGMKHEGDVRFEPLPGLRYWVPTDDSLDGRWNRVTFKDDGWSEAPGGVGFDGAPGRVIQPFIPVDIGTEMRSKNASVYLRHTFEVVSEDTIVRLGMIYDDGYLLYLNGRLLGSDNAPQSPSWNSRAIRAREEGQETQSVHISLGESDGLRLGHNVLAIHALNFRHVDRDFLFRMSLTQWRDLGQTDSTAGFLPSPTPATPNMSVLTQVTAKPSFREEAKLFDGSQRIHIEHEALNARIHFTLDGSLPNEGSPLYEGPILIEASAQVNARAYLEGAVPSPVVSRVFLLGSGQALEFSSDLPVVVVDSLRSTITASARTRALMHLYDVQEDGRSRLSGSPAFEGLGSLKVRGSSTEGRPKKAYSLEIQDVHGHDQDVSLLGMPPESDWILYAPYNFDRALMRNPLVYELSRSMGRYAVRTRFCEVYVNQRGRPLDQSAYVGVYVLMEKIKRGSDRVAIDKVLKRHTDMPEVSGGYVLKIDRLDPGDSGFTAGSQALAFVEPKESEVTSAQRAYLTSTINAMNRTLRDRDYTKLEADYQSWIDAPAWIDFHILNEFTKNPDGFRLSTYMYLPRNGPLTFGPVWDFDRTMGCDDDSRAANPVGWSDVYRYGWWSSLFRNPNFEQDYIDRWQTLRQGVLSTENMHQIIDRMAAELTESSQRNFQKWTLLTSTAAWRNEVRQLKSWVEARAKWMDSQYVSPPRWESLPGLIPEDGRIHLQLDTPEAYYTTDGSDPRLPGGQISDKAQRLNATGPFLVVDQPIHLKVRAHEDGSWSRPLEGYFVHPELASVVFSEIMYHPSEAQWADSQWREEDLEYLEVLNHGKQEVELGGFSISQGVSYTFGPGVLMPGEVRLIASNPEALAALYPDLKGSIHGPFDGRLANSGETLVLRDAAGRLVDEVAYADKDSWPEQADGEGASLERIEVASTDSSAWFASGSSNGSPGRASSINGIEVQLVRGPDGRLEIRFKSQSPGIHQLMATDQLSPASWQGMEQWESQESGQEHTFFIQAPIRGHRFFRVHRP